MTAPTKAERLRAALAEYNRTVVPAWDEYRRIETAASAEYQRRVRAIEEEP